MAPRAGRRPSGERRPPPGTEPSAAAVQEILDGAAHTVVLLDGHGRIEAVNEAWRRFARENGASPATAAGVGLDYLHACACEDRVGRRVGERLRLLLSGACDELELEYPCPGAGRMRWFRLVARRRRSQPGALLTHADVTAERRLAALADRRVRVAGDRLERALADLERVNQELSQVLAAHPDVLARFDGEGRLLDLHAGDPALLVRDLPDHAVGRRVDHLGLPSALAVDALDAIRRTLSTRAMQSFGFELEVVAGQRSFESRFVPLGGDEVLCLVRDVTEQRRAEAMLRRERSRAQGYLEIAADLLVALDRDGKVTMINPQGCETLGGSAEQILGRDWFHTFLPPEFAERHRAAFDRALAGEPDPLARDEHPVLTLDGQVRQVALVRCPVKDDGGTLAGALVSGRDVTEQRAAEAAQRASHELLWSVVQGTSDAIFVKDVEGRYVVLNEAAARNLGIEVDAALGRRDVELMPAESLRHIRRADAQVVATRRAMTREENIVLGGRRHVFLTSRSPWVDRGGMVRGVIGVAKDISAWKRAEEEKLVAERELGRQRALGLRADRLRSLGEMAAGIAHQLNQPLVGVRGLAEHLLIAVDRGWALTTSDLHSDLRLIVEQADRMEHIIQRVRVFARDAGSPRLEPVDVNEVVRSSLALLEPQLRARGVEVRLRLGDAPPPVRANPFSLEEVLTNLVLNARDALEEASPAGDARWLLVETGVGSAGDAAREVTLTVRDNGIGMDAATLERACEPFFTTKPIERGTGLGLSVAQSIVESFGGRLEIASTPGQGTTVTVRLPAVAALPVAQEGGA